MDELAEQLLELLKSKPEGFSTNPQLRDELGISDRQIERYWQAHRELIEAGLIERARARGAVCDLSRMMRKRALSHHQIRWLWLSVAVRRVTTGPSKRLSKMDLRRSADFTAQIL
jgi:biotin operon repressor